jgi:hypothetical protein
VVRDRGTGHAVLGRHREGPTGQSLPIHGRGASVLIGASPR